MRNILILAYLFYGISYSQIKSPVYLSYNIINDCGSKQKIIDDKENVHFYLGKEHFECKSICISVEISEKELDKLKLIEVNELLSIADDERIRLNKVTEKENFVKILFKNDIFKELYIYERNNNKIFQYKVFWHEEIE